jgi:hypothetical protein
VLQRRERSGCLKDELLGGVAIVSASDGDARRAAWIEGGVPSMGACINKITIIG